jgi:uncharacterized protein (DUF1697 family)
MPRYAALLRAINIGGHTVKMDELRKLFEALRFGHVESVIASGNILFDTSSTDIAKIESRIEKHLHTALGYAVTTFVRTPAELASIVARKPFDASDPVLDSHSVHVVFLKSSLEAPLRAKLAALCTSYDELRPGDREFFWRCRGRFSDSLIRGPALERAIGGANTARNINTVRRLAEKLA